jgi:hypothetical protein
MVSGWFVKTNQFARKIRKNKTIKNNQKRSAPNKANSLGQISATFICGECHKPHCSNLPVICGVGHHFFIQRIPNEQNKLLAHADASKR